jgi:MFS family permease
MSADLGGKAITQSSWLPVCNTLAVASVAPFSGYLQDIFGRRTITLIGSLLIMAGLAIARSAHSFGQGVAGLAISGAGAGIGELTALAGYVAGLCRLKNMLMFVQNCRTRSSQTAWPVPWRNCCLLVAFHPICLVRQIAATRTSQSWRWCYWISL